MCWNRWLVGPSLFILLLLTSCVNSALTVRSLAELEPPEQYNHPYDGPVVERVMPVTEVRALCMSMGAPSSGLACGWVTRDICFIILPSDGQAPVPVYRRHEIAHCNGWPANHPRDDG